MGKQELRAAFSGLLVLVPLQSSARACAKTRTKVNSYSCVTLSGQYYKRMS